MQWLFADLLKCNVFLVRSLKNSTFKSNHQTSLPTPPIVVKKTEMLGPGTMVILRSEGESGSVIHRLRMIY